MVKKHSVSFIKFSFFLFCFFNVIAEVSSYYTIYEAFPITTLP